MQESQFFVQTDIQFSDSLAALNHIGETLLKKGVVKSSYPAALLERETQYPTGIALERHAVAIPHCEAEHAQSPAIYLIRPDRPVVFQQADDDGNVEAALIIALVVTEPSQQLVLLRKLFSQLQDVEFLNQLLTVPADRLEPVFSQAIFQQ